MADSRAVDAAQAAGYTVTAGKVSGPLSAGRLHRLQRIVETADGELEYSDGAATAEYVAFAGVAQKEIRFYAKAGDGAAGNDKNIVLVVAGNNTPLSVSDDETTVTVNVATDGGGAPTSTAAEVVDEVNTHDDEVLAELGDSHGAKKGALQALTFEDIAQANDDLIFTGKTNDEAFSVDMRLPRGKSEAGLTAVQVEVERGNRIKIIVPATKTVANVKTAVEANVDANALVTVTTAGTTTNAVDLSAGQRSAQSEAANAGGTVVTALASQDLAGGADADMALRIVPAEA